MSTASVPPPEVQHARVNGVDLPYLDQGHDGGAIGILLAVHHPEWVKSLFVFEPGLATFVTDPADAQLAGEDRKDMRAQATMAADAGDTARSGPAPHRWSDGSTGGLRAVGPRDPLRDARQRANASSLISRTAASTDHLRPVGPDHGASGHRQRRIGATLLPDCGGHRPSLHSQIATHRHSRRRAPHPGRTRPGIQRSPPELPEDPVTGELLDVNGHTQIADAIRLSSTDFAPLARPKGREAWNRSPTPRP